MQSKIHRPIFQGSGIRARILGGVSIAHLPRSLLVEDYLFQPVSLVEPLVLV